MHQLVLKVYENTKQYPVEEKYALVQQMRRAAVSVAANIAEGSKRRSPKDKTHFYNMADTSLEELKYYFVLSCDLHYIAKENSSFLKAHAEEVGRMLTGLIKSLSNK